MRRRWKALVAVGAVALLAGLPFILPRDDGLGWLKKYRLQPHGGRTISATGQGLYFTQFSLDRVPPGLEDEVRKRIVRFDIKHDGNIVGSTEDGHHLYFSREHKLLYVLREPSWIEERWQDMKSKLGWK